MCGTLYECAAFVTRPTGPGFGIFCFCLFLKIEHWYSNTRILYLCSFLMSRNKSPISVPYKSVPYKILFGMCVHQIKTVWIGMYLLIKTRSFRVCPWKVRTLNLIGATFMLNLNTLLVVISSALISDASANISEIRSIKFGPSKI